MSTRIDGSGAAASASVRAPLDRTPVRDGSARGKSEGIRRQLVSTFKAAFRLDVTSEVLSEIRDRLVTLRAGLQVASDGAEKEAFVESTLGSITQLVDMADFGPAEWPDVPPREPEPGEVLSPLEASLLETVSPELLLPELPSADDASADASRGERENPASVAAFVDRAISDIDAASRRIHDVRGEVGMKAASLVSGRLRSEAGRPTEYVDPELAEASARAMRDRFTSDPDAAVRAIGELDPEAVLALIA